MARIVFSLLGLKTHLEHAPGVDATAHWTRTCCPAQVLTTPEAAQPSTRPMLSLANLTETSPPNGLNCPEPQLPAYDTVKPLEHARKIPNIIHVAWVTLGQRPRWRCVSSAHAGVLERWRVALPNHSLNFHDDRAVNALLYHEHWPEFPQLSKILGCIERIPTVVAKIDLWRILTMYRFGGIYTDMDNLPRASSHDASPSLCRPASYSVRCSSSERHEYAAASP